MRVLWSFFFEDSLLDLLYEGDVVTHDGGEAPVQDVVPDGGGEAPGVQGWVRLVGEEVSVTIPDPQELFADDAGEQRPHQPIRGRCFRQAACECIYLFRVGVHAEKIIPGVLIYFLWCGLVGRGRAW